VQQVLAKTHQVLLDIHGAAHQAQTAWAIQHAWHCHVGESAELSDDQKTYQLWCNAYRQLCRRKAVIDAPRLAAALRSLLPQLAEAGRLSPHTMYAGFLAPSTEQQAWLDALAQQQLTVQSLIHSAPKVQPSCVRCTDDAAEWGAAAQHARTKLERDPGSLLGVVVPELHAQRTGVLRAFDAVFFPGQSPSDIQRSGRPYDVSLGVALSEQPVVRSALQVLRFLNEAIPAADVTSILLSPYLTNAVSAAEQRRSLDRKLRDARQWELSNVERLVGSIWPGFTTSARLAG